MSTVMLDTCNECSIDYPGELIQPACLDGVYFPMCPICYLAWRNKEFKIEGTPFAGPMAKQLYINALAFLKGAEITHPEFGTGVLPDD